MSSPCLSAGGRAYGFDLDLLLKSPSPSPSPSTSSPSSTLSESSNSHIAISTKKARTPRKRPNQTYHEAAALLSTAYPNVFSSSTTTTTAAAAKSLCHLRKHLTLHFDAFSEPSDLLPPFSGLTGAAFLLRDPPFQAKPTFTPKPSNSIPRACESPPSIEFQHPIDDDDDFDAQSMLDEEVGEGIDSILGNLSTSNNSDNAENETFLHNACFGPHLRSLMGFRFGSAFGFGFDANVRRALRRGDDDGDWWRSPRVAVRDIVPKFKSLSASMPPPLAKKSKKKKKKVEEESEMRESQQKTTTSTASIAATNADAIDKNLVETSSTQENLKASLNLKLDFEQVLKEWSDRGSPFGDSGSPESSADVHARLAQIDLFPESGNGREASVQRYKEKRRNRLFSKKIRYQVRKVNADRRPRMKGRFVKRPALLHQVIEEESP